MRARREGQRGFVLLALLFASAAIAIQVAVLLPRAAMQAQRVREERLIYRGEQYKRAIELYFRKHQKYPQELDDLEDTNGVRYLRRRYKDPLTGEDEWRLIHMGPDGRFKDSLIYDQEDPEQGQFPGQRGSQSGFGGARPASAEGGQSALFNQTGSYQPAQAYQQAGAYNPNQPYNPNAPYGQPRSYTSPSGRFRGADRARAVRQSAAPAIPGLVGAPAQAGASGPNDPNAVGNDGQPDGSTDPNQAQYPDYSRTLPSQVPPGAGQRRSGAQGQSGAYGQRGSGISGRGLAANRGQRGQLVSGGAGFNQSGRNQQGGFGGAGGGQPMGFGPRGAGSQAASIIGNLLTQPRPGGLAGLQGNRRQQMQGSGRGMTGGIAGVASKVEERGVKVYEGRDYYNEWEFVFDHRKAQALAMAGMGGMAGIGGGMPAGQPGMTANPNLNITPGAAGGFPGSAGAQGGNAYPPGYPTFGQPGTQRRPNPKDQPGGRRSPYRNLQPGSSGYDPNRPTGNPSPNLPGLNQPGFNQPGRNQRQGGAQRGRPGYGQPRSGQPYGAQPGNPFPGVPGFPNQQQTQPQKGNSRGR